GDGARPEGGGAPLLPRAQGGGGRGARRGRRGARSAGARGEDGWLMSLVLSADLRIPPSRSAELKTLLLHRPEETLFHLAVLEERGVSSSPGESPFGFVGWPASGPLRAAAFVGGSWFATAFALD